MSEKFKTQSLQYSLEVARRAARLAADEIMRFYKGEFEIEIKSDDTPVTIADRNAEDIIRGTLLGAFPDHGFYGEESGKSQADADFLWLVDPIYGTRSFVAGFAMFSTQIALMYRGQLVLGVSSAPAADECFWAAEGQAGNDSGWALAVSDYKTIADASISMGNIRTLAASPDWPRLGRVLTQCIRTRGYGDFYHYHRLAQGQLDAVIESDVNILDIAALKVIVEAAGGRFTDLHGMPIGLDTTSVLAAPPALHAQLLESLNA